MISVEKPGSPSEILEHHGVKGMKWGFRESRQGSRDFGAAFPSGSSRAHEIRRARHTQKARKEAIKSAPKGSPKRIKLEQVYLRNPDRVTAARLTRGEKVVAGITFGVFGLTGVIPLAVGGAVTTAYAMRRSREKRIAREGALK